MADREYNAAAERVAAILHMSEQTRTDGVLISTLVGAAICEAGLALTEEMIKRGELNPARARMILAAEKAVKRDDLFGISESLANEKAMSVDWPKQHYRGEHAGWLLMREMGMSGLHTELGHSFVVGLNEQQMAADLDRFARYFDAVSAAWRKPDNVVLLDELNTEVMEGQYGVIAMTMAPSMEKVARSIDKTRADLERVAAALEGIVHSEDGGAGK
jgi:hypothetical protein